MSFSFRNLFSQDEDGNPNTGDRTGSLEEADRGSAQEYVVSELLPFIPPAIVARTGIPMNQKVQIALPEDGSHDVRLSTIYQTCPGLFAAEITPLNDSMVSLPPVSLEAAEEDATDAPAPFKGNPFADAGDTSFFPPSNSQKLGDSVKSTAVKESKVEKTGFDFSPAKNPGEDLFGSFGSPRGGGGSPDRKPGPSPQEKAFGGTPELPEGNPFADANSFDDLFKSPKPQNPPSDSAPKGTPSKSVWETPPKPASRDDNGFNLTGNSFSTLFSQKADEDKDLSLGEEGSAPESAFNDPTGEYVGPQMLPDSKAAYANLSRELGFEAFIPPGMEQSEMEDDEEESPTDEFVPPMVFSSEEDDDDALLFEPTASPAPAVELFSQLPQKNEPDRKPASFQDSFSFGIPDPGEAIPREESALPVPSKAEESESPPNFAGLFSGFSGESTPDQTPPFVGLPHPEPASNESATFFQEDSKPESGELPSAERVPAVEAPPVAEQPPAIEEPPVAEQPPAIEEPPVAEQPPAIEEPPVAEQPPAIEEPPVAEQPPAIEEPPVAEQPPAVEEPPVAEQASAIEEPPVSEQASAIEEPPAAEQLPIEEPSAAESARDILPEKPVESQPGPPGEPTTEMTAQRFTEPKPLPSEPTMQASGKNHPDFKIDRPTFQEGEAPASKSRAETEPKSDPFPPVIVPSRSGSNQSIVVQPPVFQEAKPEPETKEVPIARREPSAMPRVADEAPEMRDIELRAVFSTDENFTLRKVSQKVAALEGIRACAVVTSDRVIEAYADQSYAIGDKIQAMAEHVRGLAEMSGIVGASYFTIHMDHSIMSFFFGKKNLLAVKHKSDAFKPGTREKLILIARSIDNLEN